MQKIGRPILGNLPTYYVLFSPTMLYLPKIGTSLIDVPLEDIFTPELGYQLGSQINWLWAYQKPVITIGMSYLVVNPPKKKLAKRNSVDWMESTMVMTGYCFRARYVYKTRLVVGQKMSTFCQGS